MYKVLQQKLGAPPRALAKLLLIMKLTTLILLTAILQVSASSFAQKISLSVKNAPLTQVMDQIRTQTGYDFLYESVNLKSLKKVSIYAKNEELSDVLSRILKPQNLDFEIDDNSILIKAAEKNVVERVMDFYAAITIRGKVMDDSGNVLPGASVKAGSKATVTDSNGEFVLFEIEENTIVTITYLGYSTKTLKAHNDFMLVTLVKNATELTEVNINKGYYTTNKELNTGTVGFISGKEIEKQPVGDFLMALEGRIPGIYINQTSGVPGAALKVQLRGINSISNGTDPFYVIDGVPFNSTTLTKVYDAANGISPFANIRPDDIERIEVLKDADATAIYGSRGANGVILITTKRGKSGKTKLDFNFYNGVGRVTNKLNLLNTEQYLSMRHEAYRNDNTAFPGATHYDLNGGWDTTRYTDWQSKMIGGHSRVNDGKISISGGSLQTHFLLSAGFRKETTVFPGDYSNEIGSGLLNVNHISENEKFKADVNVNFSNNNNRLPRYDFTSNILLAPVAPPVFKPDGDLNWQNSTWTNPYASLKNRSDNLTQNLIANLILSYKLLDNLVLQSSFGYNNIRLDGSAITTFASVDPSLDPTSNRANLSSSNQIKSWIIEPQINYSKLFKAHSIEVLIGSTFQHRQSNGLQQGVSGFSSDALVENPGAGSVKGILESNYSQYRYSALFARIGYNYARKYIVNITGRNDGSSRFGPGKQFGSFGAIGAAWVFSEEKLAKHLAPVLSFGKLRGSIGTTGNDQLLDYEYLSTYLVNPITYLGSTGLDPKSLTNNQYAWETINKIEAGLELGFLKDRISFNVNFYRNRTSNQLVGYSLPSITGFSSVRANLPAVIQNKGWEFELTSSNLKSEAITWTTSINLTIPKNKLASYPNIEGSSYANRYVVGQPLSIQFLYKYQGIDPATGIYQFEDLNRDANISSPIDMAPIFVGQKYFGGVNNSISYKGLSLDIFMQYVNQTGYSFAPILTPGRFAASGSNLSVEMLDRYQNANDGAKYQKYTSNFRGAGNLAYSQYLASDARITNASFIRIKNVSLYWNLPDKWLSRLSIQNARLFLLCQNLLTITSFDGLDPETASANSTLSLPPLKMITVGFKLSL